MPISPDTYFIVTPASEFISKAYGSLGGTDLFFYVSDTNELRVVNFTNNAPGNITFVLAQNAIWVGVISQTGMVHVYYADGSGQMWYIPYTVFGATVVPKTLPIQNIITFSCTFTPQSGPPAYLIMVDDGIFHHLYAANDAQFASLISSTNVYDNAFDTSLYITKPNIAMHPLDTNRLTVHVQQITVLTDVNQVGFYVVEVPGLS